ncbi:tetratricopeptide repeat protein [Acetohalobium arabaticum]|uniref:Tetratricopeptide TPR_2 repeat protein n=1 Tax=Acetohalobium arabaticum (strain ATCC 49924 / DSM 5501 / Z-7288) TaxID=574087 RepID=D9QT83_ACEAZ|nr:tetratricopeptide repeat protein [Acetohalobium arabaticum]ADL13583.1 Tetratricopeptide TPR_2 repeat protein [Acetohalobium arabaticum DSM 5501]
MRKLINLILVVLLCITINLPLAASEQKGSPDRIIKGILANFDQIKDFKGSLVSKIFLAEETVTYRTNIMKNQQRSLTDNSYTFGRIKGTASGRLLNAMPWIYLPPDYSLLQNALPLRGQRDYLEPLNNLEDIYNLKLLGETNLHNKPITLLELSNQFTRQVIWVEKERLLIDKIEVFNGADQLVATINYNGYREVENEIWLPNLIIVENRNEEQILKINYQNWVINDGLDNEDFAVGFTPKVRQKIFKLEKKVSADAGDTESRYRLAQLYYEVLETDKAVEMLKQAVEIKPKIKYYRKLAEFYREQSRYNKAIEAIKEALVLDYKRGELHYTLGELHLQLQNIDQARSSLERAVNLAPTNKEYLERLFWTYRRSAVNDTMLENAQNTLDKLIDLAPNKAKYQIYSGDLYRKADKHHQAVHRYQRAIQITPEDSWGYIKLARSYEELDRYQIAEQLYLKAVELEASWLNYEYLGDFYHSWKNYDSAVDNYQQALKLKPQQLDIRLKLGESYWRANKQEQAVTIWKDILKIDNLKLDEYIEIAELFTDYELDNLAVSTYRQGIKEYSGSVDNWSKELLAKLHGRLARLYRKKQNYKLAAKEYQNSIQLHPYSWTYQELGSLKFHQGDLADAVELWQEVKRMDAGNLNAVYNLAIARIIQKDFTVAEDNLEYIKRFNPDQKLAQLVKQAEQVISSLKELELDDKQPGQKHRLEEDRLRQLGIKELIKEVDSR